jgi:hypothetical protein
VAGGRPTSLESCRVELADQMSKELVHHYGVDGQIRKMLRMLRKTHSFNLNFCVTNLFNYVLQKVSTRADPHYFDVWQPAHHGNIDVAGRLVSSSLYSYAIFVTFILNSIFCRTDTRRS